MNRGAVTMAADVLVAAAAMTEDKMAGTTTARHLALAPERWWEGPVGGAGLTADGGEGENQDGQATQDGAVGWATMEKIPR